MNTASTRSQKKSIAPTAIDPPQAIPASNAAPHSAQCAMNAALTFAPNTLTRITSPMPTTNQTSLNLDPCSVCGQPGRLLCDGRKWIDAKEEWGTCDKPLCNACTFQASVVLMCSRQKGKSRADTIDYCPGCKAKFGQEQKHKWQSRLNELL